MLGTVFEETMPEIETAHLRLRVPAATDIDSYYTHIHSDPDVMRYLPGGVPRSRDRTVTTLAMVIEHWHQHGFGVWSVEQKERAGLIGHCGLSCVPDTDGVVELAYAFGKLFWGKGYATQAARANLRFGFEQLGLLEIVAVAVPANIASQRVMEKIGMSCQGITNRFYGVELVLYALSRKDFQPDDEPYELRFDG
jgi:RimJ/RimL family protein N-acetyltransferase